MKPSATRAQREVQWWELFEDTFGVTREEFAEDVQLLLLLEFGEA